MIALVTWIVYKRVPLPEYWFKALVTASDSQYNEGALCQLGFFCDSGEEFSIACLGLNGWFGRNGLMIHPGELNYTV